MEIKGEAGREMERKEEQEEAMKMKSEIGIRCANALFLIASLKNSQNRQLIKTSSNAEEQELGDQDRDHDQEKELVLLKAITDLKMELIRERHRSKKIRNWSLIEFVLQILLILSYFTLILVLLLAF